MFDFEDQDHEDSTFVLDAATAHDLTDEQNILYIQGAAGDTLSLQGDWRKDAGVHRGEDGRVYTLFTAESGGEAIAVYVDRDITLRNSGSAVTTQSAKIH